MTERVPSEIRREARGLLVGEAPGRQEVEQGRPFVGGAGQELLKWLKHAGLARTDFSITNVCDLRPAGNDFDLLPPAEVAEGTRKLHALIDNLPNLRCIVPLGNHALRAVVGIPSGITLWRGSVLDRRGVAVVPMIHPAAVLRNPTDTGRCLHDMTRVAQVLRGEFVPAPKRNLTIRPTLDDVRWWAQQCANSDMLSVDIETPKSRLEVVKTLKSGKTKTSFKAGPRYLACVAIATSPTEAMSIPLTQTFWGAKKLPTVQKWVCDMLGGSQAKILQNGLFDWFWLAREGYPLRNFRYDTLGMHHTLDPANDHSLAYLTSIYTAEPYYKSQGKGQDGMPTDWDGYWTYNARDAAVTFEVALRLLEALEAA